MILIGKYDTSFAVAIRKIMLHEKWYNNEDRRLRVWQPTQKWLIDFANTRPKQVNCFSSREYGFPGKDGSYKRRDIFLVNHRNEVAYLCTVFNRKAFLYRARKEDGKPFKRISKKPVRDPVYYIVALAKENLGRAEIIDGVRQYLRSYPKNTGIPCLAETAIGFFPEEQGMKMDRFIDQEAKKASKN